MNTKRSFGALCIAVALATGACQPARPAAGSSSVSAATATQAYWATALAQRYKSKTATPLGPTPIPGSTQAYWATALAKRYNATSSPSPSPTPAASPGSTQAYWATALAQRYSGSSAYATRTATPDPCLNATEVTSAMQGESICVKGIVEEVNIGRFGTHFILGHGPKAFFFTWPMFLLSPGGGPASIEGQLAGVGECQGHTGQIHVSESGAPFITLEFGVTPLFLPKNECQ